MGLFYKAISHWYQGVQWRTSLTGRVKTRSAMEPSPQPAGQQYCDAHQWSNPFHAINLVRDIAGLLQIPSLRSIYFVCLQISHCLLLPTLKHAGTILAAITVASSSKEQSAIA